MYSSYTDTRRCGNDTSSDEPQGYLIILKIGCIDWMAKLVVMNRGGSGWQNGHRFVQSGGLHPEIYGRYGGSEPLKL